MRRESLPYPLALSFSAIYIGRPIPFYTHPAYCWTPNILGARYGGEKLEEKCEEKKAEECCPEPEKSGEKKAPCC